MSPELLPRPAAIGRDEYRRRCQALMAALPEGSAVLLPAASLVTRSNDSDYPFRQRSDFHYLTGFPEPDAYCLLLPGREAGESVLFCQERNPAIEAWTGIRLGTEGALAHFAIDEAFENPARVERLAELIDGRETLYLLLTMTESLALADEVRSELKGRARRGAVAPQALADLAPLLHEQRLIKSQAELALLRHAGEVSATRPCACDAPARPGLNEYHLQAELEHEFRWQGANGTAYDSIVGGGANACVLHYIENRDPLDGELVLIDAGAEFDLYAGDITRTFPVSGRFSSAQRQLYDIVLAAQERAIEAVTPGATLAAIHQGVVRDLSRGLVELGLLEGELEAVISEERYKRFYLHSTSHWLGLDVHDVGTIAATASRAPGPRHGADSGARPLHSRRR